MAIRFGTDNSTNYTFDLTTDVNANFGLEDDRVVGLSGFDTIRTGAGNDHLEGGNGHNTFHDGDGNDTVLGGSGIDFVSVDAGDDIYHGEGGSDWLWFDRIHYGFKGSYKDPHQGVKVDLSLTSAQDLGEFGTDRFFSFENVLGSYGNDTILGSNGDNSLRGYDGNDILYGRGGNDVINGNTGADTLIGGLGSDGLYGSAGAFDSSRDVVRYETLKDSGTTISTRDNISWFKAGQDKIDLSKLDANLSLKGNQAFKVVTGFTKALGEVKLVKSGADTIVQIDGDKDSSIDMTILVKGAHLTKGDFIL